MADLIDRAALKAVVVKVNTRGGSERFYAVIGYIFDAIAKAPTVDAEVVRHARWIERKVSDDHYQYICSNCNDYHGVKNRDGSTAKEVNENYKYCRTCGAKMDLQEGENHDQTGK